MPTCVAFHLQMSLSDESYFLVQGIVMPPRVAPQQVVVIPIPNAKLLLTPNRCTYLCIPPVSDFHATCIIHQGCDMSTIHKAVAGMHCVKFAALMLPSLSCCSDRNRPVLGPFAGAFPSSQGISLLPRHFPPCWCVFPPCCC